MAKNPNGQNPNQKMDGMGIFRKDHWEKDHDCLEAADLKYTQGEMSNPEHLEKSVKDLAGYVKKHKMTYP